MAQTTRQRIIANAAKRRKQKRNAGPRHMTAKQIRFFGTPAQKAALRKSRSSKRNRAKAKHHSTTHRRAVKKNTGEIIGYTLMNAGTKKRRKPAKKGQQSTMAKTKKKRASKANAGYRRPKHKKNAAHRGGHKHRSTQRRRAAHRKNAPSFGGVTTILTNAVFVIAGALGSKLITQMVLGTNNTGIMGYGGNVVAGIGLWFLADKVLKNKEAAKGIISGTAVQLVLRLINDYTPFGQYVSQLGMGDYQAQAFVTPQVLVDPYNSARIKIPGAWLPAPPPPPQTPSAAAAAAGVGSYGGGDLYGGRSSLY